MMQRFWSWLAVQLGKRAGLVSVIGLLITVVLGVGITQLEFATGQDSYLNKSDQVYKDNVAYQKLFGGEAMLTVITMDKGHTVDELFDDRPASDQFERCSHELTAGDDRRSRASSRRSRAAVLRQPGASRRRRHHRRASPARRSWRRDAGSDDRRATRASAAARIADSVTTLQRVQRGARRTSGPSTTRSG